MSYSARQHQAKKAVIDVEQWLMQEKIKQEVAASAGPSKPTSGSSKRPLVVLSDSEGDDDFEIIKAPRTPLSSSSKANTSSSSGPRDRGDPIWVKKRDEAQLRKYGTLNPKQQGPSRREATIPNNAVKHAPESATEEPTLSEQQATILARIMEGQSFFFTGSAGTGKSVLFRAIVKAFRDSGKISTLAITASTGMAAINIGGSTLHSWAGIGLGQEPKEKLAFMIQKSGPLRKRWEEASALIMDENGVLFDKLDYIGQRIRQSKKPFGGIQLILCGDFHQLPPVSKYGEPPALYAFESQAWRNAFGSHNSACLKEVFRQRDVEFVRLLEEMRKGRVSRADAQTIQALSRTLHYSDGIPAVELYPRKDDVAALNTQKLNALKTDSHKFRSIDIPGVMPDGSRTPSGEVFRVLRESKLIKDLELKIGAVVMLLANYTDMGLCNGSIGKIVDMMTMEQAAENGIPSLGTSASSYKIFPVVEFIPGKHVTVSTPKQVLVPCFELEVKNASDGSVKAKRVQVPLILAWAMTVHKAQGSSLDRVRIDLGRTFADGQAYVAMSRATSLEGLQVMNFQENCVKVNYRVIEWSASVEGDV